MRFDRRKTYPLNKKDGSLGQRVTDWFAAKAIVPRRVGGVIKQPGVRRFLEPMNRAVGILKHPYLWKIHAGKMTSGGGGPNFGSRPLFTPGTAPEPPEPGPEPVPPGDPLVFTIAVILPRSEFQLPSVTGGTYNMQIDWGDGSPITDPITSPTDENTLHEYAAPGEYTVSVYGQFEGWLQRLSIFVAVLSIDAWGDNSLLDYQGVFALGQVQGGTYVPLIPTDQGPIPVSAGCGELRLSFTPNTGDAGQIFNGVTLAGSAFVDMSNTDFTSADFTGLVSSSGNFIFQFQGAKITDVDLSVIGPWETNTLSNMIANSDVVNINMGQLIVKASQNMSNMFNNGSNLKTYDFSQIDWSATVAVSTQYMFANTGLEVAELGFLASVGLNTNLCEGMFQRCFQLTTVNDAQNINFDANATNVSQGMFTECSALTTVNGIDAAIVASGFVRGTFKDCSSLTTINLSAWNIAGASGFSEFFTGCPIDVASYDALLTSWGPQVVLINGVLQAELAKYTPGGAAEAGRTNFTTAGWQVIDAGPVTP